MNKNQVQEQMSTFPNKFGVEINWMPIIGTSEIADVNGWDIGYEVSDESFTYYPDDKEVKIRLENLTPEQLNQILEEDSDHFQSIANRDNNDDMYDSLTDEMNNQITLSITVKCDSIDNAKAVWDNKFKKVVQSLNLNPGDFWVYIDHPEGCEDLE
jgi:hypothetical protein